MDSFMFAVMMQLNDLIEDNIDDVRENRKELWEWWMQMQSWFFACAEQDQLDVWAEKRFNRIEKWMETHPEETAELNDPDENARLLKNIKNKFGLVDDTDDNAVIL